MGRRNGGALASMAVATLLGTGAAGAASVDDYTAFFALGDSLSDTGRVFAATAPLNGDGDPSTFQIPPDPPYFAGRFSNGPVWTDYFADAAFRDEPAFSLAFGSARAIPNDDPFPDLDFQLAELTSLIDPAAVGGNPLVSLWFGGNDLFGAIGSLDDIAVAEAAALAIGDAGLALGAAGFGDVLLFNLPDLGAVPRYGLFQPALSDAATAATRAFNVALGAQADRLRGSGIDVFEVDIEALFADLLADPGAFGFTQTAAPCVVADGDFNIFSVCSNPSGFLFFDGVHPTTRAHSIVAQAALDTLEATPLPSPVPLPAGAPLLAGALGMLALWRRRVAHGRA